MTREKAKKILRSWDGVYIGYSSDEVEEAHNMAIQALSQEPISLNDINNAIEASFRNGVRSAKVEQQPCDDAISREDAIKALQKAACYSAAIRARMIGAIEDLPPVTQKGDEKNV